MRGSYTIESAFIMSFGLFVLLSLLFLAFYLQDIQCLRAEGNRIADRAAAEGWSAKELEEALGGIAGQSSKERILFFLRAEEPELIKDFAWQQKITFPIPVYAKLFFQDTIRDGFLSIQGKHYCPEQFIRKVEAGKEVLE